MFFYQLKQLSSLPSSTVMWKIFQFLSYCKLFIAFNSPLMITTAIPRTLIEMGGGGVYTHVFMFYLTSFSSNQIRIDEFERNTSGKT